MPKGKVNIIIVNDIHTGQSKAKAKRQSKAKASEQSTGVGGAEETEMKGSGQRRVVSDHRFRRRMPL